MSIADWAFVLSIFSFSVSLAGFVWNVWSKFIYPKAKVRTTITIMSLLEEGEFTRSFVSISATNYGPTEVTLNLAIARKKQALWAIWQGKGLAILNPFHSVDSESTGGPFSGGLPKKLAIGEQFSVYLPIVKHWIEKEHLNKFGFSDTFNRNHWCSRKNVREFSKKLLREKPE